MRSIVVLFSLVFFFAFFANAEIYRYADEEGVVRFTDDLAQVPPDQRPKAGQYQEYDSGSTQVEGAEAAVEEDGRGEGGEGGAAPSRDAEQVEAAGDSNPEEEATSESAETEDAGEEDAAAQDVEAENGDYDFQTNYKRLEEMREELAGEYAGMLEEKARLEEEHELEKGEKLSEPQIAERNEKIRDFNERVKAYREKRELFEKQKADYNDRAVKKMEKTIQEHKAAQSGEVPSEKD